MIDETLSYALNCGEGFLNGIESHYREAKHVFKTGEPPGGEWEFFDNSDEELYEDLRGK